MSIKQTYKTTHRITAILIAAIILFPFIVKLTHTFNHQDHYVCFDKHSTHFDKLDVDCEFYKFKITPQYYHQFQVTEFSHLEENYKTITSQYHFISNFQKLQTTLRGPPNT